jgi:two-component system, NarL family, sensor histidine kinase UhpB
MQHFRTRREKKESFPEREEEFRWVLETMEAGVFQATLAGELIYVNKAILQMSGYRSLREITANPIGSYLPPSDRDRLRKKLLRYGRVKNFELRIPKKDGTPQWITLNAFLQKDKEGKPDKLLGIITNVTERKDTEEALRQLEDHVAARTEDLRQANQRLKREVIRQKKTEKALLLSEEKFSKAFRISPDWMTMVSLKKGRYIEVNNSFLRMSGYSREEIIGRSIFDLNLWCDEENRKRGINLLLKNGSLDKFEIRLRMRSGLIRTMLWSAELFEIGGEKCILSACHDLTPRKEMEKALRVSEDKYQLIVQNASVGIMVSQDLKIMYANPKTAEISGFSQEELTLKPLLEMVHPEERARTRDRITRRMRGEKLPPVTVLRGLKKNGQALWLEIGVVPNHWNGKPALLYFFQDVTEIREAREELLKAKNELEIRVAERTQVLQKLNKKLEKELAERKRIEGALKKSEKNLRTLSNRLIMAQEDERKRIAYELHDDLGQAMVGLKIQLSGLKHKPDPKEITKAIQTTNQITENIRRLSRELRPAVLEHLGLLEALQWLFDDFSARYHIKILNGITMLNPRFSKMQEIIIFRIFQEGLANIGKHAQANEVTIAMDNKGQVAVFSLEDNGVGFDRKAVDERNPSQSGLGLIAMQERAMMAGGFFGIQSEPGQGTLIAFAIPVRRSGKKSAAWDKS